MKTPPKLVVIAIAIVAAVLAAPVSAREPEPKPARLIVSIEPVNGTNVQGTVVFEQDGKKVKITASIGGLYPNREHRLAIHRFGDLGSPDASSVGGVFHACGEPAGELGVLTADVDGNARLTVTVGSFSLGTGDDGVLGRSVVVRPPADENGGAEGKSQAALAAGVIGIAFEGVPTEPDEQVERETTEPAK